MTSDVSQPLRYVFDEEAFSDWASLSAAQITQQIDALLRLLDACDLHGRGVSVFSQFDGVDIPGRGLVLDVLAADDEIDRDLRIRLYARLDRYPRWDEEHPHFPGFDFTCDKDASLPNRISVQFVVAQICAGLCTARLGFEVAAPNPVAVESASGRVMLYLVCNENTRMQFVRWILSEEPLTEAAFLKQLPAAFPKLDFHPQLTFRNFSRGYAAIKNETLAHLTCLNDKFLSAYQKHSGSAKEVSAAIGIDVSPEGASVHKDKAKVRARTVRFFDVDYLCEWHSKIEAYQDRIYFHIGSDRLLIGVFAKHL